MRISGEQHRCAYCPVALALCHEVIPDGYEYTERKIRPSHGKNLTGKVPMLNGRGMVPYESGLERNALLWLRSSNAVIDVAAQCMKVKGWIQGSYCTYTPDLIVTVDGDVPTLKKMGFGYRTIIEVKPQRYAKDLDVLRKACLAGAATSLPVVILTELHLEVPISGEESINVH